MKPPVKLEREWRRKLAASGFVDLEPVEGGPLNDRGNLHSVDQSPESKAHLAARTIAGEAYTRWAESVLYSHRFSNPTERRIWEMHAAGDSLREIAGVLGANGYHRARLAVNRVRSVGNQGRKRWKSPREKKRMAAQVRYFEPETLVKLAAILMSKGRVAPTA